MSERRKNMADLAHEMGSAYEADQLFRASARSVHVDAAISRWRGGEPLATALSESLRALATGHADLLEAVIEADRCKLPGVVAVQTKPAGSES